jgi:7-cyano-7-deazaguanine synthase
MTAARHFKSVVLLSGGIDSAVALAEQLQTHERDVLALSIDYGQHHSAELRAAELISEHYDVRHEIVGVNLRRIVEVKLTGGEDLPVRTLEEIRQTSLSPAYVPARNTVLISLGLAFAEQYNCDEIIIGANQDDALAFPDTRPTYIAAWQALAAVACVTPKRIVAPHLLRTKAKVIALGAELAVPFGLTVSCYNARKAALHCGRCDACILRREAFAKTTRDDPTMYLENL